MKLSLAFGVGVICGALLWAVPVLVGVGSRWVESWMDRQADAIGRRLRQFYRGR